MSFTVCFIVYLHLWAIDFNFVNDIQVCLLIVCRKTKIGQRSLYNNMMIWTFALQSCHLGEPKNRDSYIFWGKFSYFCNNSCFIVLSLYLKSINSLSEIIMIEDVLKNFSWRFSPPWPLVWCRPCPSSWPWA